MGVGMYIVVATIVVAVTVIAIKMTEIVKENYLIHEWAISIQERLSSMEHKKALKSIESDKLSDDISNLAMQFKGIEYKVEALSESVRSNAARTGAPDKCDCGCLGCECDTAEKAEIKPYDGVSHEDVVIESERPKRRGRKAKNDNNKKQEE